MKSYGFQKKKKRKKIQLVSKDSQTEEKKIWQQPSLLYDTLPTLS